MSGTMSTTEPASDEELIDAYWRAANYLSVGQIYLLDNPLLREPLRLEHVKPRLLGPLGHDARPQLRLRPPEPRDPAARPGRDLRRRPGPWRTGTWSPTPISRARTRGLPDDHARRGRAARACSGSSPSPAASPATSPPETPGRSTRAASSATRCRHAYGAAFDNPDLLVACVVGDGEAETGPLATSWHSNKFLNPASDGAVLPILHLNGYKIANPTVLARIPTDELTRTAGRLRLPARSSSRATIRAMHQLMAAALDEALDDIAAIQRRARRSRPTGRAGR